MKNLIDEIRKLAENLEAKETAKTLLNSLTKRKLDEIRPEALKLLLEAARFLTADLDTDEKIQPADNYQDLLKQFGSLKNLNRSLSQQLSFYRRNAENEKSNADEIKRLYAEIESQREANSKLTDEVAELSTMLLNRDEHIASLEKERLHSPGITTSASVGAANCLNTNLPEWNALAEPHSDTERHNIERLEKEIERLGLIEHHMKSTALLLGLSGSNDPQLSHHVMTHTSSLLWNLNLLKKQNQHNWFVPDVLSSSRILPIPDTGLHTETIELVVNTAVNMLGNFSEAENSPVTDMNWANADWKYDIGKLINGALSQNRAIEAINLLAIAHHHSWPITGQYSK